MEKPEPTARLDRKGLIRTLADFTFSSFARFGAGLAGWLVFHGPDGKVEPDQREHAPRIVPPRRPDTPLVLAAPAVLSSPAKESPATAARESCSDENCTHRVELSRVQRDLHDQVGSSLAGVTMQLEVTQRLMHSDADRARQMLTELHSTTTHLVSAVRRMSVQRHRRPETAGGIGGVGPGSCANFAEALRGMTGRMRQVVRDRLEISVDIAEGVESIEGEVGWAAFWIVNEALTNVLRHSHAEHCLVALWTSENELHVQVEDDGIGAPSDGIGARADETAGGSGLGNMVDRAAERGGWCTIQPAIPTGVVVLAALPLVGADRV
ncbi:sensor histidine kinase [Amycolatopsis nigrescens]|uniref:sensor histidine kinase n=1 Tax=Amycolatopsis nigrescens TaxID=381445 RepID=UPI00037E93BE|nr:histidine kinase [Amycolatopsis nigrescens]